eukprot:m51a1_g2473 hypothetical protein (500) ;mRNA; r:49412-50911
MNDLMHLWGEGHLEPSAAVCLSILDDHSGAPSAAGTRVVAALLLRLVVLESPLSLMHCRPHCCPDDVLDAASDATRSVPAGESDAARSIAEAAVARGGPDAVAGTAALASLLDRCLDEQRDASAAAQAYRELAQLGSSTGLWLLGACYEEGDGVESDADEAERLYRAAADRGHAYAARCLAFLLRGREGREGESGEFMRAAGERGNAEAAVQVGEDELAARNHDEAARWFTMAAEWGSDLATFYLGVMHLRGWAFEQDDAEAARLYRVAAERGVVDAQFNLALLLSDGGAGVESNSAEAAHFFGLAARSGEADSMVCLGRMLLLGDGVPRDEAEGWRLLSAAEQSKSGHALTRLGKMYAEGDAVQQDLGRARQLLAEAVDLGSTSAMLCLGWLMYSKFGDIAESERLLRMGAEHGDPEAQECLGDFIISGVIQRDYSEALDLLARAAEQRHAGACSTLGMIYASGIGVCQDIRKSSLLWRAAGSEALLQDLYCTGVSDP